MQISSTSFGYSASKIRVMTSKTFEIRDRLTFIPCLAIQLDPVNEQDRYLLARAGFGLRPETQRTHVLLLRLTGPCTFHDSPEQWATPVRTLPEAHAYIQQHFSALQSGAVIDVEYLRHETDAPKESEAIKWASPNRHPSNKHQTKEKKG